MPLTLVKNGSNLITGIVLQTDFAPEAFECVDGELLPTVIVDGVTITGDGASTPLSATGAAIYEFIIADADETSTVNDGETVTLIPGSLNGGSDIAVELTPGTNTFAFDFKLTATSVAACPSGYFVGR